VRETGNAMGKSGDGPLLVAHAKARQRSRCRSTSPWRVFTPA